MNYDVITKIISLFVELFSTLLSAGATVFLACVALYGINAWRREFKGKRDIELAEEVLELFYKARDAIRAIRSPFGYSNEGMKVVERLKSEGKDDHINLQMATVLERYEKYEETFQKLQTLRYRFLARFGARFGKDKALKPFDELWQCVNSVFIASKCLIEITEKEDEALHDQIRQLRADQWWGDGEKDKITPKVEAAVREMEEICQKIIGGG